MRNLIPIIFYGNLFYGLCALALCLETNLQHHLPPNGPHFYFLVFAGTVFYYSRIYYKSIHALSTNQRNLWYSSNKKLIKNILVAVTVLIIIDTIFLLYKFRIEVLNIHLRQWGLICIFPLVAFLYTYKRIPFVQQKQLRTIGWLKPFIIGFAWSGLVTIYPLFFRQVQSGINADDFILPSGLFWLQNFLFISALAIIFDIKDQASDLKWKLKTYPTIMGIKNTLRLIVIPLSLLSFATLFLYLWQKNAPVIQIALQSVPFIVLFIVISMMKKNQGILFYLAVIDGLMLLKGITGIFSNLYF